MKYITESIKIAVIALLVIFSVSIANAWTGPTATPPNNNAPAPINVSAVTQEKTGIFGSRGFFSLGSGWFSTSTRAAWPPAKLTLGVNGSVGAKEYCDDNGQNCVTTLGGSGTGASCSMGARQVKAANQTYPATTDGTVIAYMVGADNADNTLSGFSDTNANPSGLRSRSTVENARYTSITMPVRKGENWKVTTATAGNGQGGSAMVTTVYFVPLTGDCGGSDNSTSAPIESASAYRKSNSVNNDPPAFVTLNGAPSAAFVNVNNVTSSVPGTRTDLDGIACNTSQGWKFAGCLNSGSGDNDTQPYVNGCVTDDFNEPFGNQSAGTILTITCIK